MIAHAMGFAKANAGPGITSRQRASVYRKCLTDTAFSAFERAITAYEASIAEVSPQEGQQRVEARPFVLEDCLKKFIAS